MVEAWRPAGVRALARASDYVMCTGRGSAAALRLSHWRPRLPGPAQPGSLSAAAATAAAGLRGGRRRRRPRRSGPGRVLLASSCRALRVRSRTTVTVTVTLTVTRLRPVAQSEDHDRQDSS